MAHFAELVNGVVIRVVVVANADAPDETSGQEFLGKLFGGNWMQTSYNGKIRKNYAGIGYTYSDYFDAFIAPKPYSSWSLNLKTCQWEAPIPCPNGQAVWDEKTQTWSTP